MIIVIDGPAGSGKSSTAKEIARRLNLQFLDSGALYRAVTYLWLESEKPPLQTFLERLSSVNLQTSCTHSTFKVVLDGSNITDSIRSQQVAGHVSHIASEPEIRSFVNQYMRRLVQDGVYIADGRDLGTAVFPDADLKFFMEASLDARAQRRYNEALDTDPDVQFSHIKENLKKRDHIDSNRKADPLRKADDAIVIDTTDKSFNEQIEIMISIIQNKLKL
jgi:cytidylate kinase